MSGQDRLIWSWLRCNPSAPGIPIAAAVG